MAGERGIDDYYVELKALKPDLLDDSGTSWSTSKGFPISKAVALKIHDKKATRVPICVSTLTNLTTLRVSSNLIKEVPHNLPLLTRLVSLSLYDNKLSSLPENYSCLQLLTELNISVNLFSSLPLCVSHMTNMLNLSIASNPGIEHIDPWILRLRRLKSLIGIGRYRIRTIPTSISQLPCYNHETQLRKICTIGEELVYENCDFISGQYGDIMSHPISEWKYIGEGGFGKTYAVTLRAGTVAVKYFKLPAQPHTPGYENIIEEARLMRSLDHPNITKLHTYGCINSKVVYIMELAGGGSIWDIIEKSGPLAADRAAQYVNQTNEGLIYLHRQTPPVEHCDLKPENILLFDGVAKIADFGCASIHEAVSHTTEFKGTYHYCCPETFDSKSCGPPSDMYSFGLTIWAMLSGERPYDGLCVRGLAPLKHQNKLPPIPPGSNPSLVQVILDCCKLIPSERVTAANLRPVLRDIVDQISNPS